MIRSLVPSHQSFYDNHFSKGISFFISETFYKCKYQEKPAKVKLDFS